jgi:hypothetical protein
LGSERLDRFLASEKLINNGLMIKTCFSAGSLSDHLSIILKLEVGRKIPKAPLKFNPLWLDDIDYRAIVE